MADNQARRGPTAWLTARWNRSDTVRLEAFSDGVLAIAVTLLILDVKLPSGDVNVGEELRAAWPHYLAYLTAFFTIAVMWVNHHDLFKLIGRTDRGLMLLNALLLLSISFLPFPTALLAEYMRDTRPNQQAALLTYGLTMVVIAAFFNLTWRYVCWRGLLRSDVSDVVIGRVSRAYNPAILLYTAALPLSFFQAWISIAVWIGLALFFLLFPYEPEFDDDESAQMSR
jgi:uncharacterized membrane protein